jgi:dihydroorotate dehydrogenase
MVAKVAHTLLPGPTLKPGYERLMRWFLNFSWWLLRPVLFLLGAEQAHRLVLASLGTAPGLSRIGLRLVGGAPAKSDSITLGSLKLRGPVGLAAGLDKDGEAIQVWPALGFGFIEAGTVTWHAQPGNPQPRLFRLKGERGLINRMGFNNHGAEALASRMLALREAGQWPEVPVGANIGKSKITPLEEAVEDYLSSVRVLRGVADYFTVNVSSPNTPGLRELQRGDHLRRLLDQVCEAAGLPVMVKLSPDLSDTDLNDAVQTAIAAGCTAIITTNTTLDRPGTTGRLGEAGGMSGAPIWPISRLQIGKTLDCAAGRIPIIGAGGIRSAAQAQDLLDAGCVAVQVYSGMVFEGPGLIHRLGDGLQVSR